jgi:four helix bundle protein
MEYRFEKLKVWHQARDFCSDIYKLTKSFPKEEMFGLTSQIRRAASSIALNIAEGSNRKSDNEFARFLKIAQASLCETVTALYLALDQQYVTKGTFQELYDNSINLSSRLTATIRSVERKL